jgi:hypothetical protein
MSQDCIICCPSAKQAASICDKCMNVDNTARRAQLFKSILNTFATKAETNFNLLEATCKNLVSSISKIEFNFTPLNTYDKSNPAGCTDYVAQDYMKCQKRFNNYLPIACEADGNCLYHSIKKLMPNMTATATELRVRAMIAIVNNHMAYTTQYPDLIDVCDEFPQYCRKVKDKEHAQIWDILGLCEVLKCRIQIMCAKDPHLHRLQNYIYSPINNLQNVTEDITLMWTNELSEKELLRHEKTFSTNHFVPLLRHSKNKAESSNIFTRFTVPVLAV